MKMSLRTIKVQESTAKRTKPVDHFKKCPKCGDRDLIQLDPDVLCSSCDWDSLAWDVSRGAMNDLEQAAREIFKIKPVLVTVQKECDATVTSVTKSNGRSNKDKMGA